MLSAIFKSFNEVIFDDATGALRLCRLLRGVSRN